MYLLLSVPIGSAIDGIPDSGSVAYAQNTTTTTTELSFRVVAESTGEPLAGAFISITSPEDTAYRLQGFTSPEGYAEVPVRKGIPLHVHIEMSGYHDTLLKLNPLYQPVYLGLIPLRENPEELPAVRVRVSARQVNMDVKTYYVTEKMRKNAVTARDLLQQLPDIQYDPFQDRIFVRGKKKVLYLVNGIERSPEYVRTIDPERILKIEIHQNPVGRYALMGYEAVINIILRDNYIGWEVSAGSPLSVSYVPAHSRTRFPFFYGYLQATWTRYRTTFRASMFSQVIDVSGIITDSLLYRDTVRWLQTSAPDEPWNFALDFWDLNVEIGIDHRLRPGIVYSVDAGMETFLIPQRIRSDFHVPTESPLIRTSLLSVENRQSLYIRQTLAIEKRRGDRWQTGIHYRWNQQSSRIQYREVASQPLEVDQRIHTRTHTLRYYGEREIPLSEHWNLFGGIQVRHVWSRSVFSVQTALNGTTIQGSTGRNVRTHILQPYLYLTWQGGNQHQFRIRAGTSAEGIFFQRTDTSPTEFYLYPRPAVDLQWTPGDWGSLGFRYRMYVSVPGARDLLGFTLIRNRFLRERTTPTLSPYPMHHVELSVDLFGGWFSLLPYYEWTPRAVEQVWDGSSSDSLVRFLSQDVSVKVRGIDVSLPVPLYPGKKFQVAALIFADWYHTSLVYQGEKYSGTSFTSWMLLVARNELAGWSMGILWANPLTEEPVVQGTEVAFDRMFDFLGAFVRTILWNKRMTLTLYATSPWAFSFLQTRLPRRYLAENWKYVNMMEFPVMLGIAGLHFQFHLSQGYVVERYLHSPESEDLDEDSRKRPGFF